MGKGLPSTCQAKGPVSQVFWGLSVGAGEQSPMSRLLLFFLYNLSLVLLLLLLSYFIAISSRLFLPQLMIFPFCSSNSPLQPVAGGGVVIKFHMVSAGALGNTIPKPWQKGHIHFFILACPKRGNTCLQSMHWISDLLHQALHALVLFLSLSSSLRCWHGPCYCLCEGKCSGPMTWGEPQNLFLSEVMLLTLFFLEDSNS